MRLEENESFADNVAEVLSSSVRRINEGMSRLTALAINYHVAAIKQGSLYMNTRPSDELRSTLQGYRDLAEILNDEINRLSTLADQIEIKIKEQDDPLREEYQAGEIYF